MKKITTMLGMVFLLSLMLVSLAVAFEASDFDVDDSTVTSADGIDEVKDKIGLVIGIVQYIAIGAAVLFASITGIQFMGARDPEEKKRLGDRLKYIIIGLLIVVLSFPIISLVL
jgi:uncharacterized membrane protein YidH (DUF202 family)